MRISQKMRRACFLMGEVLGILLCLVGLGGWIWQWFHHGSPFFYDGRGVAVHVAEAIALLLLLAQFDANEKRRLWAVRRKIRLVAPIMCLVAGVIGLWVGDWPTGCILAGIGLLDLPFEEGLLTRWHA